MGVPHTSPPEKSPHFPLDKLPRSTDNYYHDKHGQQNDSLYPGPESLSGLDAPSANVTAAAVGQVLYPAREV
jgi:hypothetical protein